MDITINDGTLPDESWLSLSREERYNRAGALVVNVLARSDLMKTLLGDSKRNVHKACHIPEPGQETPEMFQTLYTRMSIGARVVEILPKESWQVTPTVYESKDAKQQTAFEAAWDTVGRDLMAAGGLDGAKSYYQDELGNPVWDLLTRADVLSGVGRYGIIVFGLSDGDKLSDPVQGKKAGRKLSWLATYPEYEAKVAEYETQRGHPRYGLPNMYEMVVRREMWGLSSAPPQENELVHWTRVQHVCDNHHQAQSSRVFAAPRQLPVMDHLYSLLKLYLGSAEMYWKGALPGLGLKTQPQTAGEVPINKEKLRKMMSDYENDLQRWVALVGMDMQSLAPQVVDPTPQINTHIEAICIKGGYPVRIFKGSERGELASSQDDKAWNDRLKERQLNYITPSLVIPFVNRLIAYGVLPEPKGFSVFWPDLTSKSDQEKADVAVARTNALNTYTAGGATQIVAPFDYLTGFLGFEEGEAEEMIENAEEYMSQKAEEEATKAAEDQAAAMDQTEEMIARGLAPDPTKANKPPTPPKGTPAAGGVPAFSRNEEPNEGNSEFGPGIIVLNEGNSEFGAVINANPNPLPQQEDGQ